MDVLQRFGYYAPAVLYAWLFTAYAVGAVRTYRSVGRAAGQDLLRVILQLVFPAFILFRRIEEPPLLIWWLVYGFNLVWIALLPRLYTPSPSGAAAPAYRSSMDILLFRAPGLPSEREGERRSSRKVVGWIFGLLAVSCAAVSYIGLSLQPCSWLDRRLERSGCLRAWYIDRTDVQAVAFSPDGALLAVGGSNKVVQLFRRADGQLTRTLTGHSNWVDQIVFAPTGERLATSSWDGTIRLWNATSGAMERTIVSPTSEGRARLTLAFSPDGALLAGANRDDALYLWRASDGMLVRKLPSAGGTVAFSPNGQLVALMGSETSIELHAVADGSLVRRFADASVSQGQLTFSPDGGLLASGSADDSIRLWRVVDGTPLRSIPTEATQSIAFSPDGRLLAACGLGAPSSPIRGLAALYQVADGRLVAEWNAASTGVNQIAFAPDGQALATVSSWETVREWRVPPDARVLAAALADANAALAQLEADGEF